VRSVAPFDIFFDNYYVTPTLLKRLDVLVIEAMEGTPDSWITQASRYVRDLARSGSRSIQAASKPSLLFVSVTLDAFSQDLKIWRISLRVL
jgi:hypothetical protein